MENWIFISILVAIVGVNCDTIVFPGKSALLSYSPARGEFPVESLFGRGFFSYIDNQGISRTVNLEPNPLLGVRVNNDGKLLTDLENTIELRKDGSLNIQKQNQLKPIKEFDERPFQDSLEDHQKEVSISSSTLDSTSKVTEGFEQSKEDQKLHQQILSVTIPKQEEQQILLHPKTGPVLIQGSVLQPGSNTYMTSQNTPLTFSNLPIVSRPSVQGVFSSENPFLNQKLGLPVEKPNNLAGVPQKLPLQLPGQIFFYPPTAAAGSMNIGAISTSSGPESQTSNGQFLLFPSKPINSGAIVPSSSQLSEINSGAILSPTSQLQPASISQAIPSASSNLPSISPAPILSQGGHGQTFDKPSIVNSSPSVISPPINSDGMITSQQGPNQALGQVVSYPTIPISSVVSSPISNFPAFGSNPGNAFFPPSRFPTAPATLKEVYMIQPENPFLSFNKNKDKPISWPKPITTTTTSAPLFNTDQKNPFLPNSLTSDVKLEVPTIQGQLIAIKPNPPQLEAALPASITSCDYHSVGPATEQIKDTPEVEKAKREHFLAHELALAQLVQARQNNDNNNKANESSDVTLTSTSDTSLLYLTSNGPLDQPVTSGPTTATFEKTTFKAVESEIVTLQPLLV